jgi:bifunctional non-homologous end joining protein LigD
MIHVVPMLARLAKGLPPDEHDFGFEVKWDGIRAIAYSSADDVTIENRNLRDITFKYPELHAMAGMNAVIDGEIVALDDRGRPSFELMQARMHLSSDAAVQARLRDVPVRFMAFDLLWHAGRSLIDLPYTERRAALEELDVNGPSWQTPAWRRGEGTALLEAARAQGLEGVMAKKLDSPYCPGKRTSYWLKVKAKMSQELVIAGWLPGEGRRESTLGALLVGHYEDGKLRYAGRVGTGYKERDLNLLMELLRARRRETSPFEGSPQPPRQSIFVEPELVADVEFTEWTKEGILRHPAYKGLRDDKAPQDVVRERAVTPG